MISNIGNVTINNELLNSKMGRCDLDLLFLYIYTVHSRYNNIDMCTFTWYMIPTM